ncbi:hypothetical protein [Bauldia litoralis]|uniref:hypothetical protein n=1 Tax=Bauldia litoralis TaxID=665467 RepID=UPI00326300D7
MAHDGHHHGPHDHHHHHHAHAPIGHNGATATTQWQTPHLPEGAARPEAAPSEPDLDLVETAFLEAFPRAPDVTSFLRLAGVPFVGRTGDGETLNLLRVEANQTTDIGSMTPHLGGGGYRYDPLPAAMTSRRQTLAFVYAGSTGATRLALAEAKALEDLTPPR